MAQALTQSDLIFPTASHSLSSTLSSLKRAALSIHNRLSSISSDSGFVTRVSEAYSLPLVANERCGGWYIPPEQKTESCYFKSTDGHMNEWSFNLRRLNLQVLDVVGKFEGCVIVDSTRRGKSMPDALSKTVPIWCCVLNRAIFPESGPHELHTSPQAVSASEHAQIERRIDGFGKQFLEICAPNIPDLRQKLRKPLRPIWVIQSSTLPSEPPTFPDFHPVVLCTASRRVHGGEGSEGGYIQGAADDQEAWSHGLTQKLFWSNKDQLLNTNEDELPDLIADLVEQEEGPDAKPILVKPTSNLFVSSNQNVDIGKFDVIISCAPQPLTTTKPEYLKKKYLHLPCGTGKLGSRDLRIYISRLPSLFSSLPNETGKILVCCPTGKDLSVGVALAILCLYTNEKGSIAKESGNERKIDKKFIKQRLTWLTTTHPTLNPSRNTLQSINSFLMPDSSSASRMKTDTAPASQLTLVDTHGVPIFLPTVASMDPSRAFDPRALPPTSSVLSPPVTIPQSFDLPGRIFQSLNTFTVTTSGLSSIKHWKFTRNLTSRLATHPSGTVTGTATITPYPIKLTPWDLHCIGTLLYAEEGEFITTTGLNFTTRRKYVYQLRRDRPGDDNAVSDKAFSNNAISVWFHEEEKEGGIGGLFVEMGELLEGENGILVAKNRETHLCGQDLYTASWKFGKGMLDAAAEAEEKWWEVRYDVVGPQKDYVSETRYCMS